LIALAISGGWLAKGGGAVAQVADSPDQPPSIQPAAPNLLINGDMNGAGGLYPFYWRPTNHFVAGMWYEWFWTGAIPEYIDGGHPHHHECYPVPPNEDCAAANNHSQGYIRWGGPFIAGIYQPVSVTPCTYYRFEAYNANQDANYHTKVGIDPTGQGMTPYNPLGGNPPINCPPDGYSYCPDPGIESLSELPSHMVWSPESNNQGWTLLGVETEALSTTVTVWTFAAPEGSIPAVSSYWDAASLTEVSFPNNRLPAPTSWTPSGFIYNVVTTAISGGVTVDWDTLGPATAQAWYNVITPTAPITHTGAFTVYFPLVFRFTGNYTFATLLDMNRTTHHQFTVSGLQPGVNVELVLLSRRPQVNACTTEVYGPLTITVSD
jgi:hypothetical protein